MDYHKALNEAKEKSVPVETVARMVYLSFPTHVFSSEPHLEFDLIDKIARFFKIPFSAVQIIGSAKTGFSLISKQEFSQGKSDLDIALVDRDLFSKYWEIAFVRSKAFEVGAFQTSGTEQKKALENKKRFLDFLHRGIINPALFPQCPERSELEEHFYKLSDGYSNYFSRISAFIYASESFLEAKQASAINHYWYR